MLEQLLDLELTDGSTMVFFKNKVVSKNDPHTLKHGMSSVAQNTCSSFRPSRYWFECSELPKTDDRRSKTKELLPLVVEMAK